MTQAGQRISAFLIASVSTSLIVLTQHYHEPWRDEAHTMLLLEQSHSLTELRQNLGFVGHPSAYYIFLKVLNLLLSVQGLAVLNAFFIGSALFMLCAGPGLVRTQRWLLVLNFYAVYQYGAFFRPYALLFFLLCLNFYRSSQTERVARIVTHLLLPCVHVYGSIFCLVSVIHGLSKVQLLSKRARVYEVLAVLAGLASILLNALDLLSLARIDGYDASVRFPTSGLDVILDGFFPFMSQVMLGVFSIPAWTAVVLILYFCAFKGSSATKAGVLMVLLVFISQVAVYSSYPAHFGWLFLPVLASIASVDGTLQISNSLLRRVLNVVLLYQAFLGMRFMYADFVGPYSGGKALAESLASCAGERSKELLGIALEKNSLGKYLCRWDVDEVQPVLLSLPESRVYWPPQRRWFRLWSWYVSSKGLTPPFECDPRTIGSDVSLPAGVITIFSVDDPHLYTSDFPGIFESFSGFGMGENYLVLRRDLNCQHNGDSSICPHYHRPSWPGD